MWNWKRDVMLLLIVVGLAACSSDSGGTSGTGDTGTSGDVGEDHDQTSLGDGGNRDAGTDGPPIADAQVPDADEEDSSPLGPADPYQPGSHSVTQTTIGADEGPGVDLLVFVPEGARHPAIVLFQHGFSMRNTYYTTMLEHVASHGFVVVAPQMYEPSFLNAPSAAEEAVAARTLYDWTLTSLDSALDVELLPGKLGLAGHSRGAKVIWLALEEGFEGATAAAGVDPVDGTGGPLGGEARVLDGGLDASLPSLFIGAELGSELMFGMACAPEGDNHTAFYEAASAPAFWALGEGYGHLDMLDDETPGCTVACGACAEGPDRGSFRTFSAGLLVAFFRWQLMGDAQAAEVLEDTSRAPIASQFQRK